MDHSDRLRHQRLRIRLISIATGVALAGAASLITYAVVQAGKVQSPTAIATPTLAGGAEAPQFDLARLGGGGSVSLAAYRGRPVIINFFASYCTYCRQELGAFAAVSARPGGVVFIGIDAEDPNPGQALAMMRSAGDRYATGVDPNGTVANEYDVFGLPETVAVDASGRIVEVSRGAETAAGLSRIVATLSGQGGGHP